MYTETLEIYKIQLIKEKKKWSCQSFELIEIWTLESNYVLPSLNSNIRGVHV